jgi:predicted nucleic acid-binding protein
VKLVVEEAETEALRALFVQEADQLASVIVEVEVVRAARRAAPELAARAQRVVSQLTLVDLTEPIRARASLLAPVGLRSLDALHIATALEVKDDLDAVVTYDRGMAAGAAALGLSVLAPA